MGCRGGRGVLGARTLLVLRSQKGYREHQGHCGVPRV